MYFLFFQNSFFLVRKGVWKNLTLTTIVKKMLSVKRIQKDTVTTKQARNFPTCRYFSTRNQLQRNIKFLAVFCAIFHYFKTDENRMKQMGILQLFSSIFKKVYSF